MAKPPKDLEATKKLMAALVRMPPKPHEDMKRGGQKQPGAKRRSSKSGKKPGD